MKRIARVDRLPMSSPADTSHISELLTHAEIKASDIVAILGKTEGNGCVNDFTRGYAVQALRFLLSDYLKPESLDAIPMVMSGGTEGGLSPHWIVLSAHESIDTSPSDEEVFSTTPALAFASVITRPLLASEIGRQSQTTLVRDAVLEGMKRADISAFNDVHYVQIKCPLLTSERVADVKGDVSTSDTLKSMGLSRGASALGVAEALGEISPAGDNIICRDLTQWSARASASAGIELLTCEVVVIGESSDWAGDLRISHTVMQDAIDACAVQHLLKDVAADDTLQAASDRIIAVLAKAEASSSGMIRNARHTMLEDSDISSTRHARGFAGGLLAGLTGHTELFVSGGAEHQGPDGGGPVAVIYRSLRQ